MTNEINLYKFLIQGLLCNNEQSCACLFQFTDKIFPTHTP